jgi:hypothetical protein
LILNNWKTRRDITIEADDKSGSDSDEDDSEEEEGK